jgi:hypothetical protein
LKGTGMLKQLFALLALALWSACAVGGGSTIDPSYPQPHALVSSAPLQSNFQAAYNDINALIGQNAGRSAPASPIAGQLWLNTAGSIDILEEWDGGAWVILGDLDPIGHSWKIPYAEGGTGLSSAGAAGNLLTSTGAGWASLPPVPAPTVASANGFSGSIANAGTAPAITLSTTANGMLKGLNGAISGSVAGVDYAPGTFNLPSGLLKSTTVSGALSTALAGTDYAAPFNVGSGLAMTSNTLSALPCSAGTGGTVPTPPNSTAVFLRGDCTFAPIPGGAGSGTINTGFQGEVAYYTVPGTGAAVSGDPAFEYAAGGVCSWEPLDRVAEIWF